jgi:hypothetical protein
MKKIHSIFAKFEMASAWLRHSSDQSRRALRKGEEATESLGSVDYPAGRPTKERKQTGDECQQD